nr:MAG TPA: hypothetical protein [Caudoviricetes sp.]
MKTKRYVQFSKRMTVLSVLAAVLVAAGTELLLWQMAYPAGIVEVCKAMLLFAGLVFVAYCGNSAVEKWALSRYGKVADEEKNG